MQDGSGGNIQLLRATRSLPVRDGLQLERYDLALLLQCNATSPGPSALCGHARSSPRSIPLDQNAFSLLRRLLPRSLIDV
jgi:hypothetical protein